MPRIKLFIAVLLALAALPALADEAAIRQSMTVEQAYQAIPHNRTRFDAQSATMEKSERDFLDMFFTLSDLAVAERVTKMRGMSAGAGNYDEILKRLKALNVPPKLEKAHALVTQAVEEQRQYLDGLKDGAAYDNNAALVESSHGKLLAAYQELMQAYPAENAHNKQAFFDHLCALDFK
jgi:hypothetical protein